MTEFLSTLQYEAKNNVLAKKLWLSFWYCYLGGLKKLHKFILHILICINNTRVVYSLVLNKPLLKFQFSGEIWGCGKQCADWNSWGTLKISGIWTTSSHRACRKNGGQVQSTTSSSTTTTTSSTTATSSSYELRSTESATETEKE